MRDGAVRYFDDLQVGDRFISAGRTITEADIGIFAGLSGDYNAIHTNREYAKDTRFGVVIAHGLLGLSITTGLVARLGIFDGSVIALLSIEDWRFTAPIVAGDTVVAETEITRVRPLDAERGIVWRGTRLVNQAAVVVQEGSIVAMLARR